MGKIKALKGKWIEHVNGDLVNLSSLVAIRKFETKTELFIKGALPFHNIQWIIVAKYKKNEKDIYEQDYQLIKKIINS